MSLPNIVLFASGRVWTCDLMSRRWLSNDGWVIALADLCEAGEHGKELGVRLAEHADANAKKEMADADDFKQQAGFPEHVRCYFHGDLYYAIRDVWGREDTEATQHLWFEGCSLIRCEYAVKLKDGSIEWRPTVEGVEFSQIEPFD